MSGEAGEPHYLSIGFDFHVLLGHNWLEMNPISTHLRYKLQPGVESGEALELRQLQSSWKQVKNEQRGLQRLWGRNSQGRGVSQCQLWTFPHGSLDQRKYARASLRARPSRGWGLMSGRGVVWTRTLGSLWRKHKSSALSGVLPRKEAQHLGNLWSSSLPSPPSPFLMVLSHLATPPPSPLCFSPLLFSFPISTPSLFLFFLAPGFTTW